MIRRLLALAGLLASLSAPAFAQTGSQASALAVTSCGQMGYSNGTIKIETQDLTGKLCTNSAVTATVTGSVSNATSGKATTTTGFTRRGLGS